MFRFAANETQVADALDAGAAITGSIVGNATTAVQNVMDGSLSGSEILPAVFGLLASAFSTATATADNAAWLYNRLDLLATPLKIVLQFNAFAKPFLFVLTGVSFLSCLWENKYGLGGGMGLRGYTDFFMCATSVFELLPGGEIIALGVRAAYTLIMSLLGF